MNLTQKEIKQRHFDKILANAIEIDCNCGCGEKLKNKDKYARDKFFVNGHNGRKYQDPKQYKREWTKRNRESKTKYRRDKRRSRKSELIQYKGSICLDCGLKYNGENGCVFDFHHLFDKEFAVSGNVMEKSLENLKKELDKCEILCSNCHRQRHAEKY